MTIGGKGCTIVIDAFMSVAAAKHYVCFAIVCAPCFFKVRIIDKMREGKETKKTMSVHFDIKLFGLTDIVEH